MKKVLGRELPASLTICPSEKTSQERTDKSAEGKKTPQDVDNLSESEKKRLQLIRQIQMLHAGGLSMRRITEITGKSHKSGERFRTQRGIERP